MIMMRLGAIVVTSLFRNGRQVIDWTGPVAGNMSRRNATEEPAHLNGRAKIIDTRR
jgi:hypothetical protein